MPKLKGSPKTGGKTKGSHHKVTKVTKESIAELLDGSVQSMREALKKLDADPYTYLNIIIKLLPYVIARQTDITSNGESINNTSEIDYSKLSDSALEEIINAQRTDKGKEPIYPLSQKRF